MSAFALRKKDEEEILRAKKVIDYAKFARNQSYKFVDWHIANYYTKTSFGKDKTSNIKKERNHFVNKNQHIKNTEVVVKITSTSKNQDAVAKHLSYMSRNGKLEILATDLHYADAIYQDTMNAQYHLQGKETIPFIHSFYKEQGIDFSQHSKPKKSKRITFNMVFSLKDYGGIDEFSFDPNLIKLASFYTLKKKFPNNFFSLVLHTDTNNPHCHICLKIENELGKRIDIRKADLFELRKEFANNLRKLGLEATATRKYERSKESNISYSLHKGKIVPPHYPEFIKEQNDPRYLPSKLQCFEIYDFGKAPYEFTQGNQQSYFITYLTKDFKKVSIWGQDLERIVKENNLKKGDFAKFYKVGRTYKMKNYEKIIKDSLYEVNEPIYYAKWDCITYDFERKSLSKEKFEKPTPQEMLKPSVKFIKKISKEHNARKPKRPDNKKHYTKEQWARYYSRKRNSKRALQATTSLHKSEPYYNELNRLERLAWGEFDTLRTLPQSSVGVAKQREQENAHLFLSSNAHFKLQFAKSTDFASMRWTASSPSGIRERLETQTPKENITRQEIMRSADNSISPKAKELEIE